MGDSPTAPRHVPIRVDAYAGSSGEQEPRTFELDDEAVTVRAVLDQWREPDGRRFRVVGSDGHQYVLLCREPDLDWWLSIQ